MPALRTKPSALLPALLLVAACAASRPEQAAPAAEPAPDAAFESNAPTPAPTGHANLDQLDESLAAYEQQLAQNESRLRAMGVRLAAGPASDEKAEDAPSRDDRFAPPPPKVGDASRVREENAGTKRKSTASKGSAGASSRPARPDPQAQGPAAGGTARPATPTEPATEARANHKDADAGRCAELCNLAHATCELETKICALAARHTEDPHYGEVCRRAGDDCDLASQACNQCSP